MEGEPMSRVRKMWADLGRVVLGASAGAVVAVTLAAVLGQALSYYPPDDDAGTRLFLAVDGPGGTAGAVLAAVAGTREIRGWAKDLVVGTLGGCFVGMVGGFLYAAVASGFSPTLLTGKFEAQYRWTGLLVVV